MELVSVIRHKVLTEGVPIRDVARQLGLSRNTIRRYVRAKVVPVPRPASPPRPAPAREQVVEAAAAIWAARRTTHGRQAAAHRDTSLGAASRRRSRGWRADGASARRIVPQRRAGGHRAPRLRGRRSRPGRLLRGLGRGRERAPESVALPDAPDALRTRLHDALRAAGHDLVSRRPCRRLHALRRTRRRSGLRQPQRGGGQGAHRRAARRAPALCGDGGPLRARGPLLPPWRRTRQGRSREPWGARALAALGAGAARPEPPAEISAALQARIDAQHARDPRAHRRVGQRAPRPAAGADALRRSPRPARSTWRHHAALRTPLPAARIRSPAAGAGTRSISSSAPTR